MFTARLGYAFSPTFLVYGKVGWGTYESSLEIFNTNTGVGIASAGKRRDRLNAGVGGTAGEVRRDFDKVLVGLNWRCGGFGNSVRAAY